ENSRVLAIPRPGEKAFPLPVNFGSPAYLCVSSDDQSLLVADWKNGKVVQTPSAIPGWEVDTSPLKLETALAWPKMKWPGWEPLTEAGKPNEFRPLVVTHAGDGSNRVFVATQHGIIYVFPNDPDAEKSDKFFDMAGRVLYNPNENEQGFLGLAIHPD